MTLNIEEETAIPEDLDYKKIIADVVDAALEFEDCPYEVELNVILTSDEEIALINGLPGYLPANGCFVLPNGGLCIPGRFLLSGHL